MSYSILSVYLLLSASVRHAPFRYRSNPTFRSPASLALSLSPAFFLFLRFFLHLLLSLSFVPILSPLFSLFLTLLARSSHIPSFLRAFFTPSFLSPLPLSSLSLSPPPLLAGLLPSRGGAQGNLTIQGPTVGLAAFYFAAAFFGADFFTAVFFAVFGSVFSATVFPAALAVDFRAVFFLGSSVLFALRAWIMA